MRRALDVRTTAVIRMRLLRIILTLCDMPSSECAPATIRRVRLGAASVPFVPVAAPMLWLQPVSL